MLRTILLGCIAWLLAFSAWANAPRNFPENSQRATFKSFDGSRMVLGSRTFPVSPALQVRNQQNLIVVSGVLQDAGKLDVQVQFDSQGAVWRVWVLTPEERQQH
ncbi:hypothetical protein GCM10025771_26110 [Niveibacterium umoris]|uniref:Uncharacterized protein n=1 Tax=Niveibacterium umoris TaxID=1193620 RepID=A0A840BGU4_9RHOO|nr:hypothetical protein [Niveibacterium umoris]MBB4012200.1 hypothetical protein [Niveibacterium umoris]